MLAHPTLMNARSIGMTETSTGIISEAKKIKNMAARPGNLN